MKEEQEKLKEIEAYLTDRFAEAIREANPMIGDDSFDRAKYYVDRALGYLKPIRSTPKQLSVEEIKKIIMDTNLEIYGYLLGDEFNQESERLATAIHEAGKGGR